MSNPDSVRRLVKASWWTLLLRAVLAIVLGIAAFAWPDALVVAVVFLFSIFLVLDGIVNLVTAFQTTGEGRGGQRVFSLVFGLLEIVVAIIAFLNPDWAALWMMIAIGVWAIVTGIGQLILALRVRRYVDGLAPLYISAAVLIVLGLAMLVVPWFWVGVAAYVIAIGAIVWGILGIVVALRVRSWTKGAGRSRRDR